MGIQKQPFDNGVTTNSLKWTNLSIESLDYYLGNELSLPWKSRLERETVLKFHPGYFTLFHLKSNSSSWTLLLTYHCRQNGWTPTKLNNKTKKTPGFEDGKGQKLDGVLWHVRPGTAGIATSARAESARTPANLHSHSTGPSDQGTPGGRGTFLFAHTLPRCIPLAIVSAQRGRPFPGLTKTPVLAGALPRFERLFHSLID